MKCYAIENHPNDSRVKIDPDGVVQTLSSRMGTGGNNTPFVLITSTKADMQSGNPMKSQVSEQKAEAADAEVKDWLYPVCVIASSSEHAEITAGDISPTLMCRAGTGGNQLPIVTLMRRNNDLLDKAKPL